MKTALLHQILSVVSEICEISENEICSHCKRADVVDARTIFVNYCTRYGFPSADVAKFIGRKRISTIRDTLANYKRFSAQSAAFRLLSTEVSKKLDGIFPVTAR